MYLLATINGEVIEQMFHVSRLKKGLLRLTNGKTVKTIREYKLEMIKSVNNSKRKVETKDLVPNKSSQTCVKTVFHNTNEHEHIAHRKLQHIDVGNRDRSIYFYHAHHTMTHLEQTLKDTIFSLDESTQEQCDSYIVSKS